MELFETIIGLLLVAALLVPLADRIGVPYPALLALAGTGMAFVPGVPIVTPDPALALALFVAPTLLDSAFDASPRDLRDNLLPVATLAVVCVGITIVAVVVVARWCVPSMPWAAAIALGAIVAPPDASAAAGRGAGAGQAGPLRAGGTVGAGAAGYAQGVGCMVDGSHQVAREGPSLARRRREGAIHPNF